MDSMTKAGIFIEDVDHSYLLHPFIQSGEINFISTRIPVSVYFLHDGQSTSLLRPEKLLMKANAMIEKWQTSLNGDTFREENMARQWRNKGAYEILLGEKRVGLNSLRQSLRLRWSFGTVLLLGSGMLGTSFFRRVVIPMKHFGEYANAKKSFILFAMGSSFGKNNKVKESVAFIHKT